ncbi:MAG: cytochrome c3 family protein [Deltaproteobacteria bacterium]|nr:cytochrome c3 family protein [Deltaproteobacteria bacterium]
MNFKHLSLAATTMVVASIVFWLGVKPILGAEVPVPPDFSYEETKPLGAVPFSHKFHVTAKKLQCPECHTKVFQMKKMAASKDMTMAKLNAGEFCGKCHDGKKAFATKDAKDCSRCHIKK